MKINLEDYYDWIYQIGPFELNKWSENIPFKREIDRHFEVWKYYCRHGVSGLGVLFHFKKRYIGFSVLWCKGLHKNKGVQ
jgi:hypothetical protein